MWMHDINDNFLLIEAEDGQLREEPDEKIPNYTVQCGLFPH